MTRAELLAEQLLTEARRVATETKGQPDRIIALDYAAYLIDTGSVLPGVCDGYLRRPPRHRVRPAKEQITPIDQLPAEGGK